MKAGPYSITKYINVILLTFCVPFSAQASALQSHLSIKEAIKEFVTQQDVPLDNIIVRLTSAKKRLNVPQCTIPLDVAMAPGAKQIGRTTVSVSCLSPQPWKVNIAVHIDGKIDVLVARHPIAHRSFIQESDLEFAPRLYSQLNRGYYISMDRLQNMEARRNIRPGQAINANLIKAQKLVNRGQYITIIAQNGSLNLRVKGKALMDGLQGQTIKVKNLSSKKLIFAEVISAGTVKVHF